MKMKTNLRSTQRKVNLFKTNRYIKIIIIIMKSQSSLKNRHHQLSMFKISRKLKKLTRPKLQRTYLQKYSPSKISKSFSTNICSKLSLTSKLTSSKSWKMNQLSAVSWQPMKSTKSLTKSCLNTSLKCKVSNQECKKLSNGPKPSKTNWLHFKWNRSKRETMSWILMCQTMTTVCDKNINLF